MKQGYRRISRPPNKATRLACLKLVINASIRHQVPAALIVSHSNNRAASKARKEVQAEMIEKLGMKRRWVAFMFGRDVRRVRASELGQRVERKYCRKTGKFAHFKEILVVVGQQLMWVEAVPCEGKPRSSRAIKRSGVFDYPESGVQLVLGIFNWRDCTPQQILRNLR